MNRAVQQPIDCLSPEVPLELPWYDLPIAEATAENPEGYDHLAGTIAKNQV